jgi:hypothetical protein
MFQRTAIQTRAVGGFLIGERAAQLFVPAPENFAHDSDFFTKHTVGSIQDRLRYPILFQSYIHKNISTFLEKSFL